VWPVPGINLRSPQAGQCRWCGANGVRQRVTRRAPAVSRHRLASDRV